jgi:hypothetical protein
MDEVDSIARTHFTRHKFEINLDDDSDYDYESESESSGYSDDEDSDSDDDYDSDDESEDERKPKHKRQPKRKRSSAKRQKQTKKRKSVKRKGEKEPERRREKNSKSGSSLNELSTEEIKRLLDEKFEENVRKRAVERETRAPPKPIEREDPDGMLEMVEKMNKMSISDPEYGTLYYKATRLDPSVTLSVRKPRLSEGPSDTRPRMPRIRVMPPQTFAAPAVESNTTPAKSQDQQSQPSRQLYGGPQPRPRTCYACGMRNHIARDCLRIKSLINERAIYYDAEGDLHYPDGSPVEHVDGETLVETITRRTVSNPPPLQSNFAQVEQYDEPLETFWAQNPNAVLKVERDEGPAKGARRNVGQRSFQPPAGSTASKAREARVTRGVEGGGQASTNPTSVPVANNPLVTEPQPAPNILPRNQPLPNTQPEIKVVPVPSKQNEKRQTRSMKPTLVGGDDLAKLFP